MHNLAISLEIQIELQELRKQGFTEEEIAGYLDFFIDNWFKTKKEKAKV